MIDFILLAILVGVTWCVASEGFAGAIQTAIICIISGLAAMNFFEPLAEMLQGVLPGKFSAWADSVALIGIFAILVTLMRFAVEKAAPGFPDANKGMYEGGRWLGALIAGYVTMAFLLTALHTAPVPREYIGFSPERPNFLGMAAPDRQWLGFTQYVSEKSLKKWGNPNIFDGPQMVIGSSDNPYPNDVWASFPIRYATRRENLAFASSPTSQPLKEQQVPQGKRRAPATSGF
jgi:hypothetical protein